MRDMSSHTINIIIIEESQKKELSRQSRISIDPDKVIAALSWLVDHNYRYRGLEGREFSPNIRHQLVDKTIWVAAHTGLVSTEIFGRSLTSVFRYIRKEDNGTQEDIFED